MSNTDTNSKDWMGASEEESLEEEGQLAIDAYQTEDEVHIQAPIAGVKPQDLEIAITDEVVTIKGQRQKDDTINSENYFTQECYWGPFSRSYLLPIAVEADHAKATLKNGILSIKVPKQEKTKTRFIKVESAEE